MFCSKCGFEVDSSFAFCPKCAAKISQPTVTKVEADAAAKYFPGWKIVDEIGRGSFGSVYKIEKTDCDKKYYSAMKVIHIPHEKEELGELRFEGMDDRSISVYYDEMVKSISQECELLYTLRGNSNIVSYEDSKVVPHTDGIGSDIYIRMELLTPLKTYATEKPLQPMDVVKLGIDICRALEVCGRYNIIHRDIKPENIFVSYLGYYKLGDFGISKTLQGTQAIMSQKGTVNYMAPEVYNGEIGNQTVDIYSLGMILYRLMNGNRLPFIPADVAQVKFSDKEAAMARRMAGEEIGAPADADAMLGAIIAKAIKYNKADRYQTAAEFRKALEEYQRDVEENGFRNQGTGEAKREIASEIEKTEYFFENTETVLLESESDFEKTEMIFDNKDVGIQTRSENTAGKAANEALKATGGAKEMDKQGKKNGTKKIVIWLIPVAALICAIVVCVALLTQGKKVDNTANTPTSTSVVVMQTETSASTETKASTEASTSTSTSTSKTSTASIPEAEPQGDPWEVPKGANPCCYTVNGFLLIEDGILGQTFSEVRAKVPFGIKTEDELEKWEYWAKWNDAGEELWAAFYDDPRADDKHTYAFIFLKRDNEYYLIYIYTDDVGKYNLMYAGVANKLLPKYSIYEDYYIYDNEETASRMVFMKANSVPFTTYSPDFTYEKSQVYYDCFTQEYDGVNHIRQTYWLVSDLIEFEPY